MFALEDISDRFGSNDAAAKRVATPGAVSLYDMLKRYAFNFHKALVTIERLRYHAEIHSGGADASESLASYARDEMTDSLAAMMAVCQELDLTSTIEIIEHIQSTMAARGKAYNYGAMSNHLETLGVAFSNELRRPICFRISAEKEK